MSLWIAALLVAFGGALLAALTIDPIDSALDSHHFPELAVGRIDHF